MDNTIKSVTLCPLCKSEVDVKDKGHGHIYIPKENKKQETWQDILDEYKKYKLLGGYMEEFYWLIENFEVPKRK